MARAIHVYRKPGCPLCDEADELLHDAAARFDFTVVGHNILEDDGLFAKYRYRVPVVVIDGIERLELRFDEGRLEAALQAAGVSLRD